MVGGCWAVRVPRRSSFRGAELWWHQSCVMQGFICAAWRPPSNRTLAVPPRPGERLHDPSMTNRSLPFPPLLCPTADVPSSNVFTWWKGTNQHCHWSIPSFLIRNTHTPPEIAPFDLPLEGQRQKCEEVKAKRDEWVCLRVKKQHQPSHHWHQQTIKTGPSEVFA